MRTFRRFIIEITLFSDYVSANDGKIYKSDNNKPHLTKLFQDSYSKSDLPECVYKKYGKSFHSKTSRGRWLDYNGWSSEDFKALLSADKTHGYPARLVKTI